MRLFFTLVLALAVSCLTACDESRYDPTPIPLATPFAPAPSAGSDTPPPAPVSVTEDPTPTPEPDMALPDEWPTAYLPENFPVMQHTAIRNVRRENGEIKMRVTAARDVVVPDEPLYRDIRPDAYMLFDTALTASGYLDLQDTRAVNGPQPRWSRYFNQEGTVCELLEAGRSHDYEWVWDITVKYRQTLTFDESVSFLWLPLDTDLGLEELVFDKWPAEYLPEGFPQPVAMTPVSMIQRKNGVFITFVGETGDYDQQLKSAGYQKKGTAGHAAPGYYTSPFYNNSKDRYYYIYDQAEIDAMSAALRGIIDGTAAENNTAGRKTVIQVIKGEDTERYHNNRG